MSLWRQLTRGLRVLTRRTAADRDLEDEVAHYLEQATDALVSSGLSPEEARRAARMEIGNATIVREQVRDAGWEQIVGTLFADLRHAARRLRGSPGFTSVSALTLALGVGASTAIFSAVNPILFEPLPYPQAGRIATIWDRGGPEHARLDITFGTYRELVERSRSFETMAVMRAWQPTMTTAAEPERFDGQRVTADYFRALGVLPIVGREFEAAEDLPNGHRVVILSDAFWQRRFNRDRAIIGQPITLDDTPYTVVGVMPPRFENVLAPSAEIWTTLQYDRSLPLDGREWGHHLRMVARLRPDVTLERASQELDTIARTPLPDRPRAAWASLSGGFLVSALQDDLTRGVRPALLAVLGAVLLVLAIACVNVTNLLLARGAQRRGEFAMRVALGAGRARLIRQMLTESLLLALLGGGLGLVVAELGVRALVALSPPGLPRLQAIGVDGSVFAFALAVTTLVGLGVGLLPALHASRGDLHAGLQRGSRRTAGGHDWTRRTLVIAEIALALMLLVSAGLLLRSLQRLFAIAPGFDAAAQVLTLQVQASGHPFDDSAVTNRFFADARDAAAQVPGVSAAGFTSQLPLSGDFDKYGVHFASSPTDRPDEDKAAFRYAVGPGYFAAMGIPLRRGRLLDAHDDAGAPPVMLINESFAARKFPGQDPIGQRARVGSSDDFTIVGIVGDVKQTSLALDQADAVYLPVTQWTFAERAQWLVIRAHGDAAPLAAAVRRAVWSVDKDQPIVRVATMEQRLTTSAAERRFALILFEAFGSSALVLAAIGIYGLLSGSVTERTREIGVRAALGASRGHILALVLRQGLSLAGIGIVIGLAGAGVASGALDTLLFGVSRLDPITYVGVVVLLLGVSAVACWIPAWRAAWVDPSITLRAE